MQSNVLLFNPISTSPGKQRLPMSLLSIGTPLADDYGVEFIDGYVPRSSVAFDELSKTWTVQILASAEEDFWNRVEDVELDELSATAYDQIDTDAVTFGFARRETTSGSARTMVWKRARDASSRCSVAICSVTSRVVTIPSGSPSGPLAARPRLSTIRCGPPGGRIR